MLLDPRFSALVPPTQAAALALPENSYGLLGPREIVPGYRPPAEIKFALCDFDGTFSLIRSGWQAVMIPQFVEHLSACPNLSATEDLHELSKQAIADLTGKNTIYQMEKLAQLVTERGGQALSPQEYKREYVERLELVVMRKRELLAVGDPQDIESMLVPGSREFLQALKDAGVQIVLASGTDQEFVEIEAQLLKIDHYFDVGIFGATALDDDLVVEHSRRIQALVATQGASIEFPPEPIVGKARVIKENLQLYPGHQLVGIGDGFVEISLSKQAGGVALGIANIEEDRLCGELDPFKRQKLRSDEPGKGADIIIPDFLQVDAIMCALGFKR